MSWVTGIQRAIDYIEDNLTEELNFDEIAKRAYASNFHFQRVFGVLCGCTLGEYIRARRLTLASSELASSDMKVIDAALKYGYDSPESFSRAFVRFHGVTPSQAKTCGVSLKSYSRLSVKLILEGGNVMDYKIEERKAFKVIEKMEMFSTDAEVNKTDIPNFWTRAHRDGTIAKLCGFCGGTDLDDMILGICYGGDFAGATEFPYSIATGYNGKPVPDGFRITEIPAHTWAIFKCKGAMPAAIQNLWRRIYTEFFPTSDYFPDGGIDFEVYPNGDLSSPNYESEIWIAVNKK